MQAILLLSNRIISSYEYDYQLATRDAQCSISNLAGKNLLSLIAYLFNELAIHLWKW